MRTSWLLVSALALPACGGGSGGGGASTPPAGVTPGILVNAVEIASGASAADLTVALDDGIADGLDTPPTSPAPALLQMCVELPGELRLAAQDRLTPASNLVTLDGNAVDDGFVVVCGDSNNQEANPLAEGPLFHLRLEPAPPRRPGTYSVAVRKLMAATSTGEAVPLASDTLTVEVVIR